MRRKAALVGLQVEAGKFSASTTCSTALALVPEASTISLTGTVAERLAARPICVYGGADTSETPG